MNPAQARRLYNRIGRFQDTQAFYERRAIDSLVARLDLANAHGIVEIGCGTGKLAERLLRSEVPPGATYLGTDISDTMVRLAADRVRPFGARASVTVADATAGPPATTHHVDRVISAYVIDLLTTSQSQQVLEASRELLDAGGLLGLVSLTTGAGGLPRVISDVWTGVWKRWPALVGGCRPVDLSGALAASGFRVVGRDVVTSWGIASEVAVAQPD